MDKNSSLYSVSAQVDICFVEMVFDYLYLNSEHWFGVLVEYVNEFLLVGN